MAGVTIRFDSDPAGALEGASQVEGALGNLDDTMSDSSDAGGDAAGAIADAFDDAAGDIEDSAAEASSAVDEVGEASEGAGLSTRALGRVGKDAIQGDLAGAANAARPLLQGLGPAAAIGAGAAVGAIGLISEAIGTLESDAKRVQKVASESFQKMAQDGVDAWQTAAATNQRLTDAYADHEDEIKKIASLTGLTFETVAAAWAGNADAIKVVDAATAEMNAQLRATPGVSVEAADATIKGWQGVLNPLTDTLKGYDSAQEKAQRLADQQAEISRQERDQIGQTAEADRARYEAQAANLAAIPETVTTRLQLDTSTLESDVDAAIARVRNKRIPLRVRGVDEYGRTVQ